MAEPTGALTTPTAESVPLRLVNLTEHEIVLDARQCPAPDGEPGLGTSSTWPRRVYPVHYADGRLVVPDLELGRDSVPAERRPGP
jgi:hypothetical protein